MNGRCPDCGRDAWAWRGDEWTCKVALLKVTTDGEIVGVCARAGCSGVVPLNDLTYDGKVKPALAGRRRRLVVRSPVDAAREPGHG